MAGVIATEAFSFIKKGSAIDGISDGFFASKKKIAVLSPPYATK
jgi:hypothetical protein